jgi:uncharacterized protein
MERIALNYLNQWLTSVNRKPLVIRGARQVGKTWLIRKFAELSSLQLIELNFEKQPSQLSFFESNDPQTILLNIGAFLGQKIDPAQCLLFLDEIQAAPQLLSKLRWFAEDLPHLPVISAGSLLEFILKEHTFSMPVGRINYMHLEPLSFEEFLLAKDKKLLHEYLLNYNFNIQIPLAIHEQLTILFKEYLLIGGMPAVVLNWVTENSLNIVNQLQQDLMNTYRDDFAKYRGRIAIEKLDEVFILVPKMLGKKFVFSKINKAYQPGLIKQILNLLEQSRVCHRVFGCSANGVPLAAEIKEKNFKEIFLDVGLCSAALGLSLNQINTINQINMINNGGIAEQVVGQSLRTINPFYIEPALYYWHREESGSNAEIDYIIQYGNQLIPIEVKAGSTGSLKSLHLFMKLKKLTTAVRINSDLPTITNVEVKIHLDKPVRYKLLSIPFYLVGQLYKLLEY